MNLTIFIVGSIVLTCCFIIWQLIQYLSKDDSDAS